MAGTAERRPGRPLGPAQLRDAARGVDRREAAVLAALAVSVLAGLAFSLSAAARSEFLVPSGRQEFPDWLAGPLAPAGTALPVGAEVGLVAVMGAAWLAVVVSRASLRGPTIAAIVALHLALMLAPPVFSTDVFGYLAFGRLGVVHGLSPYGHAVEAIPEDPVNAHLSSVWPTEYNSPYGPLFLLMTYAVVPFGLPAGLWGLKVLTAAAALGCLALVARCAWRLGLDPTRSVAFVGLNPLWLAWTVGGAHNDLPMMLAALAGISLLLAGRERLGGGVLAGAIALKATAGLLALFALVATPRPGRFAAGAAAAGAALVGVFLAAFGSDVLLYPAALLEQGQHVSRDNVPREVVEGLGLPEVTPAVKLVCGLGFATVVAGLIASVWRGGDWITAAGWATVAFLLTTTSLHTWYVAALLPLAALSGSARLRIATVAMTLVLAVVQLT